MANYPLTDVREPATRFAAEVRSRDLAERFHRKLLDELGSQRSLNARAIVEVSFALLHAALAEWSTPGLEYAHLGLLAAYRDVRDRTADRFGGADDETGLAAD